VNSWERWTYCLVERMFYARVAW